MGLGAQPVLRPCTVGHLLRRSDFLLQESVKIKSPLPTGSVTSPTSREGFCACWALARFPPCSAAEVQVRPALWTPGLCSVGHLHLFLHQTKVPKFQEVLKQREYENSVQKTGRTVGPGVHKG